MIDIALASLVAQILIGAGQIGIVYYGISRMMQASDQRARAGERQERNAERHHTEVMAAFDTQRQTLDMQRQALETLIARTGGSGTA